MNANLANILNSPILISPEGGQAYLPLLAQAIKGVSSISKEEIEEFKATDKAAKLNAASQTTTSKGSTVKYVGLVNITGAVTKYSQFCGPAGMKAKEQEIKNLLSDDSISGIVLKIDSPGGQASYIDIIANTIREASKPIVAYVEGGAYSAGYWLASACQEIYLSSSQDGVGSVGAYITLADYTKYFEKEGIDLKEIYAPQSTKKNKAYKDVFAEKSDDTAIKADLAELVDLFIADVQLNRNITDADALAGATFRGQKAIDLGLADGFKSFQECVNRVIELSNNNQNKNNGMNTENKNFKAISKVAFNDETVELTLIDGEASLNEESLTAIENRLSESADIETANTDLNNDLTAAKASNAVAVPIMEVAATILGLEVPTTKEEVTAFNAALTTLKTERDDFAGRPGAATTDTPGADNYDKNKGKEFAHVVAAKKAIGLA